MKFEEVEGALEKIEGKPIVLFTVSSKHYAEFNFYLLKIFVEKKGYGGIYVTINMPYKVLIKKLEKHGIPTGNIQFIDVITKFVAWDTVDTPNCHFISNPTDLTGIGISIDHAAENFKDKDTILFLDSLSTLFIYNHAHDVTRFMHFLISKLRIHNIGAVFITVEEDIDSGVMSTIFQLCDRIIPVEF
ncbi:MAG: hypothetical protein QXP42_02940 [Candidatus Micrarchaeia archaeon]